MDDEPRALAPWSVTRTRSVIRDRWIDLSADDCLTDDGHVIAPYYVLRFPDWVQVVAIDDADHVVLIEQYRHGLGCITLEVPSGAIDPDDENPIAAGARELSEETGYTARSWRHVGSLPADPSRQNNHCRIVLALGAHRVSAPKDDPAERIRVRRVPVDEAVRLAMAGEIAAAVQVAALALALSAIGRWRPDVSA